VRSKPGRPAVESAEMDRLWRAEWTDVPTTYWIDRQKHHVLRIVAVSAKGARMETIVTFARVNEELADSLFSSPVPAGATRVDAPK
jgi:outer membrane lipoprotein-sorting protein